LEFNKCLVCTTPTVNDGLCEMCLEAKAFITGFLAETKDPTELLKKTLKAIKGKINPAIAIRLIRKELK
jgi:hypothetical protein